MLISNISYPETELFGQQNSNASSRFQSAEITMTPDIAYISLTRGKSTFEVRLQINHGPLGRDSSETIVSDTLLDLKVTKEQLC